MADAAGFSLALHMASASPHEVTLVEGTLDRTFANELPGRLIGDKACDSDKLDARLEEAWGIDDRPEPEETGQNAIWRPLAALPPPLESRAAVRLAAQLPPPYHKIRVSCRKFSGNGATGLHHDFAQIEYEMTSNIPQSLPKINSLKGVSQICRHSLSS